MPAKSRRQFRVMQAAAHGKSTKATGLSEEEAAEFVKGQSPKKLPEKAPASKSKGKKPQDMSPREKIAAGLEAWRQEQPHGKKTGKKGTRKARR